MRLDNFTFFIYEIVRAIRVAARNLNLNKKDIDNIFYRNAHNIINNILNIIN